jgi:sugar lactone lactonase YvrE
MQYSLSLKYLESVTRLMEGNMRKKGVYLLVPFLFLLFAGNSRAEININCGLGYYTYYVHSISDEARNFDDSGITTETEAVYCNVFATYSGHSGGVCKPSGDCYLELRWFRPNGQRETNLGTFITIVHSYQGGCWAGIYGWMVIKGMNRVPGKWRVEHWVESNLIFTEYFDIVRAPNISISPPHFETLEVIDSFNTPDSDPDGLAFDGTNLWHTNPHLMVGTIYKLDTLGNVIDSFDSPGDSPSGLTFDGTYLWSADRFNRKIYKLDSRGNVIDSFDSPGSDPQGLTFDGTFLWNADWDDLKVYQLDTSGNIVNSFATPGTGPNGLTFDGTSLWNTDFYDEKIYKLDTLGNIIDSFDSPGDNPSGLTFDGTYLWNADRWDLKIYKIEKPEPVLVGLSKRRTFTVISDGTLNLEIGKLSITGPHALEFYLENDTCSDQILDPSEECKMDIVFLPKIEGEKTANLEIPYNHPFEPVYLLNLSGTAIPSFCDWDFEPDGDVDGNDLTTYAGSITDTSVENFAAEFGRNNCPQ